MNDKNTDVIKSMFSCDEFIEMYTTDKTSRVQLIKGVDPIWTDAVVNNVGAKNPIISRIIIQSDEILKSAWFEHEIDKDCVRRYLYKCKEELLACENISQKLGHEIEDIISEIKTNNLTRKNNIFVGFPQVADLEKQCANFLYSAKAIIKYICYIVSAFSGLECKHNNFSHLADNLKKEGVNTHLVPFLKEHISNTAHIIDLRNYYDHQAENSEDKKTIITNFKLLNDETLKVIVPQWQVNGEPSYSIKEEMEWIVAYLLEIAEAIFIQLVATNLKSGFFIGKIPIEEIDLENPIRYRVAMDFDFFNLPIHEARGQL